MTFAQVSPTYQDAVRSLGKGVDHQVGVDHAGTHHPDDAAIGGILDPGDPGQIGPRIGAPVATEGDNQRFVLVFHVHHLSIGVGQKVWRPEGIHAVRSRMN